jgi:starch synthase
VFESIRLLDLDVDLIHCNDWQTSLIPIYLRTEYSESSRYEHLATLLTIHNLAYQGRFWHWDMLLTGLDWKYFNWRQLEFFGELNLLKGGIVFADAINTVSPKYAEEIQRAPLGCGLEGALHQRRHVLSGILNGIDDTNWNPACDPHVLPPYSTPDWKQGKAAAKVRLQQEFNLAAAPRAPLVGLVGRLTEQKGMDLALTLIEHWARSRDVQWVVLGSGQADYEQELRQLAVTYPDRVVVRVEFNGPLAHRIMAAADLFLMPSRFEPCGLSQMYAMRYGAVPVVHDTGGLHDTVHNLTSASRLNGTANGFAFERFDLMSCDEALSRACDVYRHEPKVWEQLVVAGMSHDWSWRRSAEQYVQLYQQTVARARQTICA